MYVSRACLHIKLSSLADSCTILGVMKPVIDHCRNDYNWFDDDTRAFLPNWQDPGEENRTILEERRDDPFVYQNSFRFV